MDEIEAACPPDDRTAERRLFPGATRQVLGNAMRNGCKVAGLPHYSPHDLRHRYASVKIAEGLPVTPRLTTNAVGIRRQTGSGAFAIRAAGDWMIGLRCKGSCSRPDPPDSRRGSCRWAAVIAAASGRAWHGRPSTNRASLHRPCWSPVCTLPRSACTHPDRFWLRRRLPRADQNRCGGASGILLPDPPPISCFLIQPDLAGGQDE